MRQRLICKKPTAKLWLSRLTDCKQIASPVKSLKNGERGRNRTFNLLIKSQLLCQLSYAPIAGGWICGGFHIESNMNRWLKRQRRWLQSLIGIRARKIGRRLPDVLVVDRRFLHKHPLGILVDVVLPV